MPRREWPKVTKARQKKLKALSYDEYLQSDEWQAMRAYVWGTRGRHCQLCGGKKKELHIHHAIYRGRGQEKPTDLTMLCRDCHHDHHRKAQQRRNSAEKRKRKKKPDKPLKKTPKGTNPKAYYKTAIVWEDTGTAEILDAEFDAITKG